MIRKPLAFAIVLLIAGLAPAAAIIGFCARMPCCSHMSSASLAFATDRADCCTTITCYETPSVKMTTTGIAAVPAAPALAAVPVPPHVSSVARAVADASPPSSVRHRLAILSTLLI